MNKMSLEMFINNGANIPAVGVNGEDLGTERPRYILTQVSLGNGAEIVFRLTHEQDETYSAEFKVNENEVIPL